MKQRDATIDVLKGFGIIFVLMGHSMGGGIHNFFYSFHMPLFFLVSGYLYKQRTFAEQVKRDFLRLMLPFFFTETIILIGALLMAPLNNPHVVPPEQAFEMLYYGNGGSENHHKIWGNFASVGSVWFLPALFWGKAAFALISRYNHKMMLMLSTLICVVAVGIGQYLVLPFCFMQGLTSLVFICIGYCALTSRNISLNIGRKEICCVCGLLIFWLCVAFFPVFDMYQLRWKLYVIPNIVAAVTGTFFFFLLSKLVVRHTRNLSKFLQFVGKYSLVIMCFSPIKYYLFPIEDFVHFTGKLHFCGVVMVKLLWVTMTIVLVRKVPQLRRLFKIN